MDPEYVLRALSPILLCPEIVPGAGVGACGFSSDGLMRGSQSGDPDLALTARQSGRVEGSYTPHS